MIRRTLVIGSSLLLCASQLQAIDFDQARLDSLNRCIAEAKTDSARSKERLQRLCFFYNYDMNDSLAAHAPEDMEFNRKHGFWDNYYETWEHKANDLIFSGKVNTGLRELKQMHNDAVARDHKYGLGLAYYGMGNAYISMEHYDEAQQSYDKALKLLKEEPKGTRSMILDLYSYYCDSFNEKHDYAGLKAVLPDWLETLKRIENEKTDDGKYHSQSYSVWYAYYYLACAQAAIGLGEYDEAAKALDEVKKRTKVEGDFIYMSHLYYRAQLLLATGHPEEALRLNSERIAMSEVINDVSSPVMIRRQRAEILKKLGRYEEAADTYWEMYQLKDTLDSRQLRDQTSELTTLYRLGELANEQERIKDANRLQRMRFLTAGAALTVCFMLAFLIYWYIMTRRLRRKNEELTIAHKQAQESSLMKTKFIQNMSHEIRTPLNILSGFSQIIAQDNAGLSTEMKREACEKIIKNTNRITTLINHLLALSEADSRTIIKETEAVGCNELCTRAVAASGIGEDARHRFSFETKLNDAEQISTSPQYVVESLCRLLDNAQKFSPEGSTIRLTCYQQEHLLVIAVENMPLQPIPAAEAERIFEPFVQLDEFHEGVGVGLTVSRNVIRLLGGDIVLDTNHTAGTRFVLTLPFHNNK